MKKFTCGILLCVTVCQAGDLRMLAIPYSECEFLIPADSDWVSEEGDAPSVPSNVARGGLFLTSPSSTSQIFFKLTDEFADVASIEDAISSFRPGTHGIVELSRRTGTLPSHFSFGTLEFTRTRQTVFREWWTLIEITPGRHLFMQASSPIEEWYDHLPLFQSVLDSIRESKPNKPLQTTRWDAAEKSGSLSLAHAVRARV